MTRPSAKRMTYRRTIAAGHRSYGDKAYTTSAETLLQHLAQIGCENIRLNKGITEHSYTNQATLGLNFVQRTIKRSHPSHRRVTIIFDTRHPAAARIYKCRFHNRDRRQTVCHYFIFIRFRHTDITQQIDTPHRMSVDRYSRQPVHSN